MSGRYALFEVAVFCPDCDEVHRLRVMTVDGRFPTAITVGSGPGAGWDYSPTDEDLGVEGGVSVPVYRATGRFETPKLPPIPWGAVGLA